MLFQQHHDTSQGEPRNGNMSSASVLCDHGHHASVSNRSLGLHVEILFQHGVEQLDRHLDVEWVSPR